MLRIGLDIDDTIGSWRPEYLERFGQPKSESEITRIRNHKIPFK